MESKTKYDLVTGIIWIATGIILTISEGIRGVVVVLWLSIITIWLGIIRLNFTNKGGSNR